MKSLKKISSLIGLTLLAGGVLVAIPFVSTSCGKKTVVTYTLSGTEVSYGHALTITASATNRVGDFTWGYPTTISKVEFSEGGPNNSVLTIINKNDTEEDILITPNTITVNNNGVQSKQVTETIVFMYDGEPGIPYNDLSSNMQIYKVVFYGNGNDASSSQQTLQFKVPEPGGGYGGISLTEASGWLSIHAPTDDDYHISDNDGFNGNKDDPYYSWVQNTKTLTFNSTYDVIVSMCPPAWQNGQSPLQMARYYNSI